MIEEQVFSVLSNDANISAIVGSRIYPKRIPQGESLPAITYMRVSNPRLFSLAGMSAKANPRIQIDCWADSYSVAKDLGDKVIAAMVTATAFKIGAIEDHDIDEDDHRVSADFSIWF